MADSPPPFFENELQRALAEQAFGINAFSVLTSDRHSAVATVSLLEDQHILITLTRQGYSTASTHSQVFETIEGLLQTISPAYEKRKQEQLVKRLEDLF